MRQEIYDLIDAVRGLGLELTDRDPPKCVRITGDTSDFWQRLERVQRALEAVDSGGALAAGGDALEPKNDPEKLRAALDGVMRLFQLQGGNLQEAIDIVRDKMGLDGAEKKNKGYITRWDLTAPKRRTRATSPSPSSLRTASGRSESTSPA